MACRLWIQSKEWSNAVTISNGRESAKSNKSNSNLVFAALFATSDAAADSISMEIKLTIFIAFPFSLSPSPSPSLAATVVTMGSNVATGCLRSALVVHKLGHQIIGITQQCWSFCFRIISTYPNSSLDSRVAGVDHSPLPSSSSNRISHENEAVMFRCQQRKGNGAVQHNRSAPRCRRGI